MLLPSHRLLLPCLLAVGCSSPVAPDLALAAARQQADPDADAWLMRATAGDLGFRLRVPLASIPAAARRSSEDFVQPGGELLLVAREEGPAGAGFRIRKAYPGLGQRSILVDDRGRVLERDHEIGLEDLPLVVRRAAAGTAETGAAIFRVLVVQGRPDNGTRYLIQWGPEAEAAQTLLDATGVVLRSYRWTHQIPQE